MNIKVYHGTNSRFDKFDKSKARIRNDLYGGGIAYFTDNLDIAKSYARTMSSREGIPLVYECTITVSHTFDTRDTFTGKELTKFFDEKDVEAFARGARLLSLGKNRLKVLSDLKGGKMSLTGEQVFRGLSGGMQQTAQARKKLEKLRYDSLRYDGGMMEISPIKHNVYLIYDPNDIKIEQRYVVKPKSDNLSTKEQFTFI